MENKKTELQGNFAPDALKQNTSFRQRIANAEKALTALLDDLQGNALENGGTNTEDWADHIHNEQDAQAAQRFAVKLRITAKYLKSTADDIEMSMTQVAQQELNNNLLSALF